MAFSAVNGVGAVLLGLTSALSRSTIECSRCEDMSVFSSCSEKKATSLLRHESSAALSCASCFSA
jgi:hypothetical protein